jgi:hypothetical protein
MARGHEEPPVQVSLLGRASSVFSLKVQVGSLVYGCVQMNPFVKPPDPLERREQGAALSENQVIFRSNVTASTNAQRTDDTAAWDAEP